MDKITIREMERRVIRRAVDDLLAAGFLVGVFDGEDTHLLLPQDRPEPVLDALFSVDAEYLTVQTTEQAARAKSAGGPKGGPDLRGCVFLVHGNDGHDVIADYTAALQPHLAGARDVADRLVFA